MPDRDNLPNLPRDELVVVNVGLELFYESLVTQGLRVAQVNWRPPAGGDPRMVTLLDRLSGRRTSHDE